MSIELSQVIHAQVLCDCCDGSPQHHTLPCPRQVLENYYWNKPRDPSCPTCVRGRVQINVQNYWECVQCRTQFCAAPLGNGHEGQDYTFLITENCVVRVVQLADRGDGTVKEDLFLHEISEKIRAARRARRDELNRSRLVSVLP